MKKLIFLLILISLVGCKERYRLEGSQCRDMETGKYVKVELCK